MEEKMLDRRRTEPDAVLKLSGSIELLSKALVVSIITFLWILLSSIFIISRVAKYFSDQPSFQLPVNFDRIFMGYSIYMLIVIFALCAITLLLESMRHHRKTDKFSKSIVIFGILSFLGIIFHLLYL
jgi:hypothetical protein